MPLFPGAKLGPYEIVAAIGAGGMGEVYRARDTRLGRDVAVKVLPQHLSSNPELKERFDREARAIFVVEPCADLHASRCGAPRGRRFFSDGIPGGRIAGRELTRSLSKMRSVASVRHRSKICS